MKKIIVVLLILCMLMSTLVSCGAQDAKYGRTAMSLEDVVVTQAMMTFFLNDHILNWYDSYFVYIAYGLFSVKMDKGLKEQTLTSIDASYMGDMSLEGKTWYNYFTETVIENVEMYLIYANAAKKEGITLSAEDMEEIDAIINDRKADMKRQDLKFEDQYGKGVTEQVVRECYELIYLASNYSEHFKEKTEQHLHDEDGTEYLLNYVDSNKDVFYSAECSITSFTISELDYPTRNEYDFAVIEALNGKLFECSDMNTREFYYETESEIGRWIFSETDIPNVGDTKIVTESSVKTDENGKEYEELKVSVYELVKAPSLDMAKTHNFAYMLSNDRAVAQAFLDDFLSSAQKNREEFEKIAQRHNETLNEKYDMSGSQEEISPIFVYASVDKAKEDYCTSDYSELNDWIDDELRINGDISDLMKVVADYNNGSGPTLGGDSKESGIINILPGLNAGNFYQGSVIVVGGGSSSVTEGNNFQYDIVVGESENTAETDNGGKDTDSSDDEYKGTISMKKEETYYAVIYFEGHDEPAWYVDAFAGATQEIIDDWYAAELEKKLIQYDLDVIDDIKGVWWR